jgi:hypothetical protein
MPFMHAARIADLLRLGPSERIIFEREARSPEQIAHHIASLANSYGGTLVIGINDRRAVTGVRDLRATLGLVSKAAHLVNPSILLEPEATTADGKQIVLLDVPQGYDTPYTTTDGHIPVRSGTKTVFADDQQAAILARRAFANASLVSIGGGATDSTARRMQPKSATVTVDLDHIMLKLERLIIANADLARKLDQSNSWQSRLTDQLIGAVLGMIVSTLVLYLLGIG